MTVPASSTAAHIESLAASNCWATLESHEQIARAAKMAAIPPSVSSALSASLRSQFSGGLFHHQAAAIQLLLDGRDVALTTPTSSGKSLAFMTGALEILLRDRQSRIVALYPMKALGNDQLGKWQKALAPFGLKVAVLDGDTKMAEREALLAEHHVLIMTPDVLHAWFMANLHRPVMRTFRDQLRMLVLDEAHVYDGVFGSSMAYLLRRLEACGPAFQVIASSATIGNVDAFLSRLTGRTLHHISADDDGSPRRRVVWHRIAHPGTDAFGSRVEMMKSLAGAGVRFIAFADSRKSAELHAFALRRDREDAEESPDELAGLDAVCGILPYRSGFEAADRKTIEAALASGQLRGVIATSALELGVDIPGIECVILIDSPPSQKSLWQRAGRTGRNCEGTVLLMETAASRSTSLSELLSRPVEANQLSLDNRQLEFIHVLCAAHEAAACGDDWNSAAMDSLSPQIAHLLAGERAGGQDLHNDLFDLKAKAGGNPHRTFSLRSGNENNFEIFCQGQRLGTISFPQVLREAYPGAVYYHLGKPYRVRTVKTTKGVIEVSREKGYTTTPQLQSRVFVTLRQSDTVRSGPTGFVYSGDLQIAERVTGFREKRGPKSTHTETYGPRSMVSQRSFDRWLRSTGICWALEGGTTLPEEAADRILAIATQRFGLCRGDLGIGRFQSQQNPWGTSPVTGLCIYDRIEGGLHLTDELFRHFPEIAAAAHEQALTDTADPAVIAHLHELATAAADWHLQSPGDFTLTSVSCSADGCIEVIQPGSPAFFTHHSHHEQVTVITFMPGPEGLEYLVTLAAGGTKRIKAAFVRPIDGETKMIALPESILAESAVAA